MSLANEGRETTLQVVADTGVRIAIDDFGVGYSNLAHLRRLRVHALKLSRSFVTELTDPRHVEDAEEDVVSLLIRLAHSLDLTGDRRVA